MQCTDRVYKTVSYDSIADIRSMADDTFVSGFVYREPAIGNKVNFVDNNYLKYQMLLVDYSDFRCLLRM